LDRLDEIIALLKESGKKPPLITRIIDVIVTIVTILSVLSVIEIIKGWTGG
jgi:hypothetical protein